MSKENIELDSIVEKFDNPSKCDLTGDFSKNNVLSCFDKSKPFCGFPRASNGAFSIHGKSSKGSYTDTSKYIPLYQSVLNLQQGKSVAQSSSVNLVTSDCFDFGPSDKVPKDYKPHDGLLYMDIADVDQMCRDLKEQLDSASKALKDSDERSALLSARSSLKKGEKIADDILVSMSDKTLVDLLTKYNSTIQ